MPKLKLISFILLATVLSVVNSVPVNAIDVLFNATNDALYYNDEAVACSAVTSVTSSGSVPSSAEMDKNAEAILKYMTGKGFTLAQASGFVGNMVQESGLNPAIIQGGAIASSTYSPVDGVGFGLVQWTFTPRQGPLVTLASSTKRPVIDMGLQLDYVWQEITTTHKSTLQALTANNSISPTEAAIIVHGRTSKVMSDPRFADAPLVAFEGSNDDADGVVTKRGGAAEEYYDKFKGKIPDGSGVTGGTSTTSGPSTSTSGSCSGAIREPTEGCPITKAVTGYGGVSNDQLSSDQLIGIYGEGGEAAKSNLETFDFLGKSLQVHKLVAPCLQAVVDDIKASGVEYTINQIGAWRLEPGAGLPDPKMSYHFYGAALDINPETNPFVEDGQSKPYDMPQEYVDSFLAHGFTWGGNWGDPKDYMHFEFNGLEP